MYFLLTLESSSIVVNSDLKQLANNRKIRWYLFCLWLSPRICLFLFKFRVCECLLSYSLSHMSFFFFFLLPSSLLSPSKCHFHFCFLSAFSFCLCVISFSVMLMGSLDFLIFCSYTFHKAFRGLQFLKTYFVSLFLMYA